MANDDTHFLITETSIEAKATKMIACKLPHSSFRSKESERKCAKKKKEKLSETKFKFENIIFDKGLCFLTIYFLDEVK